jgi:hypothetical protein
MNFCGILIVTVVVVLLLVLMLYSGMFMHGDPVELP